MKTQDYGTIKLTKIFRDRASVEYFNDFNVHTLSDLIDHNNDFLARSENKADVFSYMMTTRFGPQKKAIFYPDSKHLSQSEFLYAVVAVHLLTGEMPLDISNVRAGTSIKESDLEFLKIPTVLTAQDINNRYYQPS